MKIYERIAKKLKKERALRKITQKVLAKKCKLSRITIYRAENVTHKPSLITVLKLAKYFKISVEEFCGLKKKKAGK